jgi:putative oxidoreductase
MSVGTIAASWAPRMLSVLRIITGLMFFAHGTSKYFGFPGNGGNARMFSLMGLAGLIELIGGTLVTAGLFTRIAAFIMSGEMALAYFMGHFSKSFYPIVNGGELAIMFCFVFLYIAAAGPGPWSIDAMRKSGARN